LLHERFGSGAEGAVPDVAPARIQMLVSGVQSRKHAVAVAMTRQYAATAHFKPFITLAFR